MSRLKDVEHRAVFFVAESIRHLHEIVRRNAHEILVECAVMDGAQAQSVADYRLTSLLCISDDVGGVQ
jgi:hypothetical protein